jgi:small subunit ribosomal protein S17e
MGNVKTTHIKVLSEKLIELHPDKFSTDFEKNKEALENLMSFDSKTIRNQVAGYIAHDLAKLSKLNSLKITYHDPNLDKRKKRRRR